MTPIFSFWEPADALVPYVGLCMRTWTRGVRAEDVVVLDHANLRDHAGDVLDLDLLRRAPPALQKDAAMVAVLHRRGGIFLDADTLVASDLAPLVAPLARSEVVVVALHLAFVAARPRARLLARWLPMIEARLLALRTPAPTLPELPWDYLGNALLYAAMDEVIRDDPRKPRPMAAADRAVDLLARLARERGGRLARLAHGVLWRRRLLYFRTRYHDHLTSLDRDRYAFMPERLQPRRARGPADPVDEYRRYWFEPDAGAGTALRDGQPLIALHHSWTPDWYARLSEREVLAHPCRLSRTLRRLLEGGGADAPGATRPA